MARLLSRVEEQIMQVKNKSLKISFATFAPLREMPLTLFFLP
jgi:hypothetical protein